MAKRATRDAAAPTTELSVRARGRYELIELVGEGGAASVYRARDLHLGRNVAVKLLHADAAQNIDRTRYEAELDVLASFSHHGIVTLLDAGVDETEVDRPRPYLVMEFVSGVDLRERIRSGSLTPRQIAQIGYDMAEALEYVHGRGVLHRDIKPSNILLSRLGGREARTRAKLTDFGAALRTTEPGTVPEAVALGTAAYLSPEQVELQLLTPATDIYSLGLVLLECFTGERAYPGDPEPAALARLTADPAMPAGLAQEWRELLLAMTSIEAFDRPTAPELVDAMRAAIVRESGRHRLADDALPPEVEAARMDAVRRYQILDTPPDGALDRITAVTARSLDAPIALISIVDEDRIWFKSHHGLEADEMQRVPGLCSSAILEGVPWVVENARADPRATANPMVTGEFGLQFYAGVPLRTPDGHNLGTLCVFDFEPRSFTNVQIETLVQLAGIVMSELDRALAVREHSPKPFEEEAVGLPIEWVGKTAAWSAPVDPEERPGSAEQDGG